MLSGVEIFKFLVFDHPKLKVALMDDTARGDPTQFWERFTVIPCVIKHLKG